MINQQHTESKINSPVSEEYEARKKRLEDAIQLKKPDRVPVAPVAGIF